MQTEVTEDTVAIYWYGRKQLALAIEFIVELVRRLYGIEEINGLELRDPYAGGAVLLSVEKIPDFVGKLTELLIPLSLEEADLVMEAAARACAKLRFEGGGGMGSIALDIPREHQDKHLRLVRDLAEDMARKHSIDFRA